MSPERPMAKPRVGPLGLRWSPAQTRAAILGVGLLLVVRLGHWVPLPGVDLHHVADLIAHGIPGLREPSLSHGLYGRVSVFALGLWPFVYAWALCALVCGQSPAHRVARWRRWLTALIAVAMAMSTASAMTQTPQLMIDPGPATWLGVVLTLVAGTMLLVWLGEQITKTGLCDGIWLIVAAGFIADIPNGAFKLWQFVDWGVLPLSTGILILALLLAATALVVVMESARRRVHTPTGSGAAGQKADQAYVPVDMATILPAIVAGMFLSGIAAGLTLLHPWLGDTAYLGVAYLAAGQPLYLIGYAAMIVVFTFVATAMVAPRVLYETGGGVEAPDRPTDGPKDRPADRPADGPPPLRARLDHSLSRLTSVTAVYLLAVLMLPDLLMAFLGVPIHIGGVSMLIVVLVMLDILQRAGARWSGNHATRRALPDPAER